MNIVTERKYDLAKIIEGYNLTIFESLDSIGQEQYTAEEIINVGLDLYEKRKFMKVIKLLKETDIKELSFKLEYVDAHNPIINRMLWELGKGILPITWQLEFKLERNDSNDTCKIILKKEKR